MFNWLPFGGIVTEKDRLDSKNYQTGMYKELIKNILF